jgi:hypothetical protein
VSGSTAASGLNFKCIANAASGLSSNAASGLGSALMRNATSAGHSADKTQRSGRAGTRTHSWVNSFWLDVFLSIPRQCHLCGLVDFARSAYFYQFLHPSTKALAHQCAAMQRFNVPYDFGKPLP